MKLPYEEKVSEEFAIKAIQISNLLGIKAEWLMICIAIETAKTFSAKIRNLISGAIGLIQFMPSTALGLDTSTYELSQMSEVEQLNYVYKYLSMYKGKMHSLEDVYLSIFYPAAVGEPDNYKMGLTPELQKKIAIQNPAYDINKDNVVEKREVREAIMKFVPKGYTV